MKIMADKDGAQGGEDQAAGGGELGVEHGRVRGEDADDRDGVRGHGGGRPDAGRMGPRTRTHRELEERTSLDRRGMSEESKSFGERSLRRLEPT